MDIFVSFIFNTTDEFLFDQKGKVFPFDIQERNLIPTVLDSFQYFTYVIIIHLGYIFIFYVFVVLYAIFYFPLPFLLFILWCFILTQMKRNILQSAHLSNIQPGRQSWVELFINCFLKKRLKNTRHELQREIFSWYKMIDVAKFIPDNFFMD